MQKTDTNLLAVFSSVVKSKLDILVLNHYW